MVSGMQSYDASPSTLLGDLIYVRLLDTEVVVLNSCSVATELLEKRSHIYSDRPFIAILKA